MNDFLSNIWVKRCVSVFNLAYLAVISLLTYATFLYKLEFVPGMEKTFLLLFAAASLFFMALMIYTRHQPLTRLMSLLLLPLVFLLILFNMGQWVLIIPPLIVAIVMFFAAGTNENVKVIMGTIYLLLYVLGLVAYFVLNMLMGGSAVETRLDMSLDPAGSVYGIYEDQLRELSVISSDENTISPDGRYRFYLVDVKDSAEGAIKIYVEPCNQDRELKFFTLKQQGIRKTIVSNGIRGKIPASVGWTIRTNSDGTREYAVQYRLTEESELKESSVTDQNMPDKNYLGFLGIS